jgi:hypothetical protein
MPLQFWSDHLGNNDLELVVEDLNAKGLSINNSVTFVFWRRLCRAVQSCSSSRHGRRDARD